MSSTTACPTTADIPSTLTQLDALTFPSILPQQAPIIPVYISLGSNQGNRIHYMHTALLWLQNIHHPVVRDAIGDVPENAVLRLVDTGFMYESSPLYYTQQGAFLNTVVRFNTNLSPLLLLKLLKRVELSLGRRYDGGYIRNGPRCIDLDIVLYDALSFKSHLLTIPHPRFQERGFVLQPLHDMLTFPLVNTTGPFPSGHLPRAMEWWTQQEREAAAVNTHISHQYVIDAYNRWSEDQKKREMSGEENGADIQVLKRVLPFSTNPQVDTAWRWQDYAEHASVGNSSAAYIMGILNLTPDSFSGGLKFDDNPLQLASELVAAGADLIDVGGESTRPNAAFVDEAEELRRILPVITAIRKTFPHVLLSVDTYKPRVAEQAVQAGCHMINDIQGGVYRDSEQRTMLDIVRKYNVPYVCMHMRGDSQTMTSAQHTTYHHLVDDVRSELEARFTSALTPLPSFHVHTPTNNVQSAVTSTSSSSSASSSSLSSHVVYKWLLVSDPGIGFAKTADQNMHLLSHLSQLRPFATFPQLIGCSRKRFIRTILHHHQQQRHKTNEQAVQPG